MYGLLPRAERWKHSDGNFRSFITAYVPADEADTQQELHKQLAAWVLHFTHF